MMSFFILLRAATYAVLFTGLILVLLPARLLLWAGIDRPQEIGLAQACGIALAVIGAVPAIWSVLAFARVGRGTPAPFDAPRRLVTSGPYRFVRNPMYLGAGLALAGAALFYQSLHLLGYTALFFLFTHLCVVLYEEPGLRATFEEDYPAYCRTVRRWWPRL